MQENRSTVSGERTGAADEREREVTSSWHWFRLSAALQGGNCSPGEFHFLAPDLLPFLSIQHCMMVVNRGRQSDANPDWL